MVVEKRPKRRPVEDTEEYLEKIFQKGKEREKQIEKIPYEDTEESLEELFKRGKEIERISQVLKESSYRIPILKDRIGTALLLGATSAGLMGLGMLQNDRVMVLLNAGVSVGSFSLTEYYLLQLRKLEKRLAEAERKLKLILSTKPEYRRLMKIALLKERERQHFDHSAHEKLRKML